ncbi:MAG TPA: DUF2059 domain-containing protein [Opitutaceae bacterium]|jgi:hypothetical protein|nr:DUF2059 domain-containing protein [Opitutaceae bacterium]
MKTILKPLTAVLAALCLALTADAQVTKEQEAGIRKMMRLTGMIQLMEQINDQMVATLKQDAPAGVPEGFWSRVREKRMNREQVVGQMIPVYAKYFSVEDLKAINAFYESPAGQHLVTNLPLAMQENMKIGQAWGQKVSQEILDDLQFELRRKQNPDSITVPGNGK